MIPDWRKESRFAERVEQHSDADVFAGLTTVEQRRDRIRESIAKHDLAAQVCGQDEKHQPLTYAQVFERLYGEPLTPTTTEVHP